MKGPIFILVHKEYTEGRWQFCRVIILSYVSVRFRLGATLNAEMEFALAKKLNLVVQYLHFQCLTIILSFNATGRNNSCYTVCAV